MGICWSCLRIDPIQDPKPLHPRFKVINVDDDGNALSTGIMELTPTDLTLHTRKGDTVLWPYLCLRRYGFDADLFSFECGRRCNTGQGIFAFKCAQANELFALLQQLMQCNSINVMEEPMMRSREGHTPQREMSHPPQTTNTPAFPGQALPNGYPGCPLRSDPSQPVRADNRPHSLVGLQDKTHTYVNTISLEGDPSLRHCAAVRPSTFPETTRGAMPIGGQGPLQPILRGPLQEKRNDPQVLLQPSSQEVKFMLGPTPAQRERERLGLNSLHNLKPVEGAAASDTEPSKHLCNSHGAHPQFHHVHRLTGPIQTETNKQITEATYENINGLRGIRKLRLSSSGMGTQTCRGLHPRNLLHPRSAASLPRLGGGYHHSSSRGSGGGALVGGGSSHRRTALLNYENLPSLPPVWERSGDNKEDKEEKKKEERKCEGDEDEEGDEDDEDDDDEEEDEEEEEEEEEEFLERHGTPNGYHRGIHKDALHNYVNTEPPVQPPRLRHTCAPLPWPGTPGTPCDPPPGFDFCRRSKSGIGGFEHVPMLPSKQLNYIQVDIEAVGVGETSGGVGGGSQQSQPLHQRLPSRKCDPPAPRRSEFYAIIDLKKTTAMSNLQKALPRDDGTSRKTRHNSTDLPL